MAEIARPGSEGKSIQPLFLGDHPIADLLNTIARIGDGLIDIWQGDEDVMRWLRATDLLEAGLKPKLPAGRLLQAARHLRELVRALIERRKDGKALHLEPLNEFLEQGRSFCQVLQSKSGVLQVRRRYGHSTPEQLLAPLAELAANFLATADFDLVRRCEGEGCVLWFYDRTKSHRRRWCSMEVCGNRHKVAAFRERHDHKRSKNRYMAQNA